MKGSCAAVLLVLLAMCGLARSQTMMQANITYYNYCGSTVNLAANTFAQYSPGFMELTDGAILYMYLTPLEPSGNVSFTANLAPIASQQSCTVQTSNPVFWNPSDNQWYSTAKRQWYTFYKFQYVSGFWPVASFICSDFPCQFKPYFEISVSPCQLDRSCVFNYNPCGNGNCP